jgi:hypothetical protein
MRDHFLKNLWLWKCGLPEQKIPELSNYNLLELRKTEWSFDFEYLMRNRLVFGALRYGKLGAKNKPQYDRIKSCIQRLKVYEKTGNLENLVDVANIVMCEFIEGIHPNKHFHSVDDGVHVNEL